MRKEILDYLNNNPQLKQYVREQPIWYRKITRNPHDLQRLEIASMHHYKKTIPHQVEKFASGVQMASMMISMFQAMNQK